MVMSITRAVDISIHAVSPELRTGSITFPPFFVKNLHLKFKNASFDNIFLNLF
jgi:hypothetical protein